MKKQKEMTDIIQPTKKGIARIIMDEIVLKTITPSGKEDQAELLDMVEVAVEEFLTELHDFLLDEDGGGSDPHPSEGAWDNADKILHNGKWYVTYNELNKH
jgi:hypothetical protein